MLRGECVGFREVYLLYRTIGLSDQKRRGDRRRELNNTVDKIEFLVSAISAAGGTQRPHSARQNYGHNLAFLSQQLMRLGHLASKILVYRILSFDISLLLPELMLAR